MHSQSFDHRGIEVEDENWGEQLGPSVLGFRVKVSLEAEVQKTIWWSIEVDHRLLPCFDPGPTLAHSLKLWGRSRLA